MADIVAKRFFASRRATLIQAARPLDSKVAHLEGAADFCNKIGTKRTIQPYPRLSAFAQQRHWLCTAAMILMPVSAPIKVLA
jgi:hypothetical protein